MVTEIIFITAPIIIFLILACAIMDRFRGDPRTPHESINRFGEKLIYGATAALLTPVDSFLAIALVAAAFALGSSVGWGEAMGAYLEDKEMDQEKLAWWQVGMMKKNVMVALVGRGFVWAAPIFLTSIFFESWPLAIAVIVAFPTSLVISKHVNIRFRTKKIGVENEWEEAEWIRGILVGLITFSLSLLA